MSSAMPTYEFDVEIVDRTSGQSSHLRIDADSADDAKRRAGQRTGQLVGEARRLGESSARRTAKTVEVHREWTRDNPPMTKSELRARRRFITFAVLFALNGIAFLIWSEVSAHQTAEQLRVGQTLAPLLQDRFASDNAIGASANALEQFGREFRDVSVLNSSNMRTVAYSLYAACSLILGMLCALGASLVKLRVTIRQAAETSIRPGAA